MAQTKVTGMSAGLAVVVVLAVSACSLSAQPRRGPAGVQKKERHPCIICSRGELAGLKARLRSDKQPYKLWREKLQNGAGWEGGISSAFSALLFIATDEQKYRDSAAKALIGVADERWSKWGGGGIDWGLDATRDFMMILRGYDLMKGIGALTKEQDARIRDALYEKTNKFYHLFDQIGNPSNHELRAVSSLGVAGMVLADYKLKGEQPKVIFHTGFEKGATGWKPTSQTGEKFGLTRAEHHSGKCSLHYWSGSAWSGFQSPHLPKLEAGKDYALTFWVKGEKAGHLPVSLIAGKYNPRIAQPIIEAGRWTKYCATFRIPESAEADLSKCYLTFVQGEGHCNADWYLDDIKLYSDLPKRTPAEWLAKADWNIRRLLVDKKLIAPSDFSYTEGPIYAGYTFELLLPYLNTYRVFSGKDHPLAPLVYGCMRQIVLIRRPWGSGPNIGDGDGGYSRLWFLVNSRSKLYAPALFRWNWRTGKGEMYQEYGPGWLSNDLAEMFGNFIVEPKASPPKVCSLIGPKYHYQVFRSGWEPSAVYMLLQAKHYTGVEPHAQADTGSFLIDGFGRDLAIDCGYGGWGNSAWSRLYRKPLGHNLILVNGKGPIRHKTYASVGAGLTGQLADYTEINMKYGDAAITRRVLFPAHRYFVIADTVEAEKSVNCDWLIHSPGTEAKVGDNKISWTNGKAGLLVRFAAPVKMQRKVDKRRMLKPPPPGETREGHVDHAYFLCRRSGTKVDYLTLLFPTKEGQEKPKVETHQGEGFFALRVKFDGVEDVVIFSQAKSASWGGITTTGRLAMVRLVGKEKFAFIRGPGKVSIAGKEVLNVKPGAKSPAAAGPLK